MSHNDIGQRERQNAPVLNNSLFDALVVEFVPARLRVGSDEMRVLVLGGRWHHHAAVRFTFAHLEFQCVCKGESERIRFAADAGARVIGNDLAVLCVFFFYFF